jgi:hypothetical protein
MIHIALCRANLLSSKYPVVFIDHTPRFDDTVKSDLEILAVVNGIVLDGCTVNEGKCGVRRGL